jgi:hypothetical protein
MLIMEKMRRNGRGRRGKLMEKLTEKISLWRQHIKERYNKVGHATRIRDNFLFMGGGGVGASAGDTVVPCDQTKSWR